MLLKCYTHYASKFGKLSSGHKTGKDQFSFQPQRKAVTKNVQTTRQLHLFHMLRILQVRLQQYMKRELPDIQAGFGKGRETRDQIANIFWIIKKAREFQKNIYFLKLCGSQQTGKFFKRLEYHTTSPALEICMQIKKQQLKLDMEQWTGSKLGKKNVKAVYCTFLI